MSAEQPDQDWHSQLPSAVPHSMSDRERRERVKRALEQATRAVSRNDWKTYDQWMVVAANHVRLLRNC